MTEILYIQYQTKYQFIKGLCTGGFGRICKIKEIKTNKQFIIKKIQMKSDEELQLAKRQIKMMTDLPYPEVMKVHQYYIIHYTNSASKILFQVGIVMELADGSLKQMIKESQLLISIDQIIRLMVEMTILLFKLQLENIAHRDIKPDNILYFKQKDGSISWKLADFGLALDLNQIKDHELCGGSYDYASPKLKKKFDSPQTKLITNPFKDDVYSFGITLVEFLTGSNNYSIEVSEKLRRDKIDERLIKIIESMLDVDESRRPCFKELRALIEKYYPSFFDQAISSHQELQKPGCQKIEQINEKEEEKQNMNLQSTIKKQVDRNQTTGSDDQLEKTVKKTYKTATKIQNIVIGNPISSVLFYEGNIICGSQQGEINILKDGQIICKQKLHKKSVTMLKIDDDGNLWSAGNDGNVHIWNKNFLLKFLKQLQQKQQDRVQRKEQQQQKQKNNEAIYHAMQQQQPPSSERVNGKDIIRRVKKIKNHKCGISYLKAKDSQHYALGFFDGSVYIKWDGAQFHKRLHDRPVTGLQWVDGRMYSCGLDGVIKIINTSTMELESRLHMNKSGIASMWYNAQALHSASVGGEILTLNLKLERIGYHKMSVEHCISSQYDSTCDKIYSLTVQGAVMDGQAEIGRTGQTGANCMSVCGHDIVVGAYDGTLSIMSRQ